MSSRIVLNKKDKTIKIVNRKSSVKLEHKKSSIKLAHSGKVGPQGQGVPAGGSPGQVLVKTANGNEWQAFDATDKYFQQSFNVTDSVTVDHNLNKFPAVTVHDSSGDEVEGHVEHSSTNQLSVTFSAPFSGIVTCS